MKRKVIVIGGGIAGLSAGIYAQRCGFDVTILESHSIAGGNCTSWKRKGYLFEGGMHWLTGSNPNEPVHKLWQTVGALDDSVTIHCPEPFMEYNHHGTPIRLYRNVDTTEKHLISVSPADEKEIKRLCGNIRKVQNLMTPITDIRGVKVTQKSRPSIGLLFSSLSAMHLMKSFANVSRDEYVNRFSHEGLRCLIRSCTDDGMGVVPLFFTFGTLARGDGGFPEGGSLPFVERMVKTFTGAGGTLLLSTPAERVLIENGGAVDVVVGGERRMPADAVIVTADTLAIDHLFDAPLKSPWLDQMRKVTKPTMNVLLSFGIDADLKQYNRRCVFQSDKPIHVGRQTYEYITFTNYAHDPVYSPEGKTALTVSLPGDTYDFWLKAKEEDRYEAEKQRLADLVTETLAALIPETSGRVEVCDVATPLTYVRYCGNWKGSWMTDMTRDIRVESYPAVIKGLSGVYFAGQRMMPPGGLPVALMSGRTAVQYLCRDMDTVFVSEA